MTDVATNGAAVNGKRKAEDDIGTPAKRSKVEFRTSPSFIAMITQLPAIRLAAAKEKNVVFVAERTDKVPDVFKGLVDHGFLSCPVLQKTGHKYYGFLDVADVVKFVVDKFGPSHDSMESVQKLVEFQEATVNDIMKYPLTRRNPFHPFTSDYSLFSVMEALAREKSLHRVPLVDNERQLKNLLTQSQVALFLKTNLPLLGDKGDMPIELIPGAFGLVISTSEDATAISAFELMIEKNISGVAVVDANGKLTGNLSLRDLKTIMTDARMFWRLRQTVKNFIRHLREDCAQRDGRPRTKVVVSPKTTVAETIELICENSIHRIFIVDGEKKPVGVVSLKDILGCIIGDSIIESGA